jgi:hypothetical protein
MEHRRSMRKRICHRVILESTRGGVLAAAKDLSLGGMYIEPRPAPLAPNAKVTALLLLSHNGTEHRFRLPAEVVRRTENGAALMFLQIPPDVIRELSDALSYPMSPDKSVSFWAPAKSTRSPGSTNRR